ncbi:hypothetical protein [Microcoleus sp. FACHB-68]|uniref:hypothetical protein n=1 Tax=Microcoleus sp. FACHB-68 TaxID=2692826 RepID=UPI001682167F|nr:hypothetical protein [Microcoleus sp. FACHB-68]MBD1939700.1 hypothetical protein [Microcoleus sp. FACHB-68]
MATFICNIGGTITFSIHPLVAQAVSFTSRAELASQTPMRNLDTVLIVFASNIDLLLHRVFGLLRLDSEVIRMALA